VKVKLADGPQVYSRMMTSTEPAVVDEESGGSIRTVNSPVSLRLTSNEASS